MVPNYRSHSATNLIKRKKAEEDTTEQACVAEALQQSNIVDMAKLTVERITGRSAEKGYSLLLIQN